MQLMNWPANCQLPMAIASLAVMALLEPSCRISADLAGNTACTNSNHSYHPWNIQIKKLEWWASATSFYRKSVSFSLLQVLDWTKSPGFTDGSALRWRLGFKGLVTSTWSFQHPTHQVHPSSTDGWNPRIDEMVSRTISAGSIYSKCQINDLDFSQQLGGGAGDEPNWRFSATCWTVQIHSEGAHIRSHQKSPKVDDLDHVHTQNTTLTEVLQAFTTTRSQNNIGIVVGMM